MAQSQKDSLIVFVGKKLSVQYNPPEIEGSFSLDRRYNARYAILQLVHGTYEADTIEFTASDHYGKPNFSMFETVLLFVNYRNGKLYHVKYQYYDLYQAKNGKWASPYRSSDYDHPYKDSITVKPVKIPFEEEVRFSVMPRFAINETTYKKPYYEVRNGYAFPIYGNYVEDLLQLKQETILKQWRLERANQ